MNRDIYELIKKIINKKVKGADTYINNGSRWLIFTDEKKWIFELTKEGTLWYNFYFFQGIFKLISLDVVDNQRHITKWVVNFIRNGVKDIGADFHPRPAKVENTIQNGVKETKHNPFEDGLAMEEAIQNGVKQTNPHFLEILNPMNFEPVTKEMKRMNEVNIVLENGIEETWGYEKQSQMIVNEVINKGKKTIWNNETNKL